jgi:hypothetical protein
MELLKKIKSALVYMYYYRDIRDMRAFCKRFLDSNMTSITVSALYCEKAVECFYERIIRVNPNLEFQLRPIYEEEIERFNDLRICINRNRSSTTVVLNIINRNSGPFCIAASIKKHGDFDKFVTEQKKHITSVFNAIEEDMFNLFN